MLNMSLHNSMSRTPRNPRRNGNRGGFTLIEAVAAVVMLSVAIPPMLWSIRMAHVGRVDTVLTSQARWLVTEKIEDVIADRHSTTRGYSYLSAANYPDETPVSGYGAFSRTVTFSETGADLVTAGTGFKKATVTVSWTDGSGTSRTMSIATVVTEY